MCLLAKLRKTLKNAGNKERAIHSARFFKTGPGEYGEGDRFLGIPVPEQRKLAKQFKTLDLNDIDKLLQSDIHEERFVALVILVQRYKKGTAEEQTLIYDFYLARTDRINNWDLVDSSAPQIVGEYLLDKNRNDLYRLAQSKLLWDKRIAILATFSFIRNQEFDETLAIAEILLIDDHDLIHKAVGWMLREVGKRDKSVEELFLSQHYRVMPRTMLRYAIERFTKDERQAYLSGAI